MRGADTNILTRLALVDDERQHAIAVQFADGQRLRGEPIFVTGIALCEFVWVLESRYRLPRDRVAQALQQLMDSELTTIDNRKAVSVALRRYKAGPADFADYLIGEISLAAGCDDVVTFDRKLSGAEGFTLLG